jgi:hypothetical protein
MVRTDGRAGFVRWAEHLVMITGGNRFMSFSISFGGSWVDIVCFENPMRLQIRIMILA